MPPYFHGWRRKLGVVTLGMACVATVAWVRSQAVYDNVGFDFDGFQHNLFSIDGMLMWDSSKLDPNEEGEIHWWTGTDASDPFFVKITFMVRRHFTQRIMPYWSIVIPLTLLSAYLLLTKPRVAKPKTSNENPTLGARGT